MVVENWVCIDNLLLILTEIGSRKPDDTFFEAVSFAQSIFARTIASVESKARAKALVDEAIEVFGAQIIVLPQFAP